MIRDWTEFFNDNLYVNKCPFKTRPLKEVKEEKGNLQNLHRSIYNGAWSSPSMTVSRKNTKALFSSTFLEPGEFLYPQQAYDGK